MLARLPRPRWPAAALTAGALLAGGAAAGYAVTRPPGHDFGTVPAAATAAAVRADHAGAVHSRARGGNRVSSARPAHPGTAGLSVTSVPVRLRIPVLEVSARIVPVGVAAGGALGIPADPSVVGWWAGGASPGERAGAIVLAGHIDSAASGPGALLRLQDLRPGAVVSLTAAGHLWWYVVRALRAYPKASLPARAIFGQQVRPRLVIVSCGGPFDAATGHYLDNIVAYAIPVASRR